MRATPMMIARTPATTNSAPMSGRAASRSGHTRGSTVRETKIRLPSSDQRDSLM